MTEADIIKLLKQRYERDICIDHLRMGTGFGGRSRVLLPNKPYNDPDCERVIDLFVFAPIPSKMFRRIAFEIKTSTNDFCRELADPTKRRAALRFSNKFYFVTPEGIINPKKIPAECGLIEVKKYDQHYELMRTVEAPWHDNAPTWAFLASVLRRLDRLEEK